MVTIFMVSAKMATLGLLKIKVFWNKLRCHNFCSWGQQKHFITRLRLHWRCGYNCSISMITISYGFDQENPFFERWSWFKLNNLGLALAMTFKFYTSVAIGLKLTVRKFLEANSFVCRSYRGKTGRGSFSPHPELNRVNDTRTQHR